MAESGFQEKTEQATPKHRKDAEKKGQVAKSMEVTSVFVLSGALAVFFFAGHWMLMQMAGVMDGILGNLDTFDLTTYQANQGFAVKVFQDIATIIAPICLVISVCGIAGNVIQTGFMLTPQALKPKFSKLNPASGIKKLVSLRSLVELVKSILKLSIVGAVAYLTVKKELSQIPMLINYELFDVLSFLGRVSMRIILSTCIALFIMAILDFTYQKFQHEEDLKMTLQEVKDESKNTEGDPKVKQRIRSAQAAMMRQRMISDVPDATVVITNPTRLAVAIKFEFGSMFAPQIVAKGAGAVAAKIRQVARDNDVPLVENKPLARLMFKTLNVGDYIPAELYQAVAEILAYIYKLKGRQQ